MKSSQKSFKVSSLAIRIGVLLVGLVGILYMMSSLKQKRVTNHQVSSGTNLCGSKIVEITINSQSGNKIISDQETIGKFCGLDVGSPVVRPNQIDGQVKESIVLSEESGNMTVIRILSSGVFFWNQNWYFSDELLAWMKAQN
ncbi:MAG: hypothetical protein KDD25_03105 [Bdellovibrionales bacterium]|nr:hypothetical protein [Bdellovibrionales bacterium]